MFLESISDFPEILEESRNGIFLGFLLEFPINFERVFDLCRLLDIDERVCSFVNA